MPHPASGNKSKIYQPALHAKLIVIKISVKAKYKEIEGFTYLRQKFPRDSEAKMKEFSLHSYLKTKPLFQNYILQNEEPGRHLKMSAETL